MPLSVSLGMPFSLSLGVSFSLRIRGRAVNKVVPSLLWVDDFWKQAGKYIFCREDDGVLILPPNRVYKINKTGAKLIAFLKNGGKAAGLAGTEHYSHIEGFFKTLSDIYGGNDALPPGNVKRIPFDFDYTRLPVLGEIAVTYRCNNRCLFCYAGCGGRGTDAGELSTVDWKRVITIFKNDAKIPFFSFSGGEPLLRPDLEKLIKYASDMGFFVNLVSNGTLADRGRAASLYRAGLRTAQISLEAPGPEYHDALAGRKGAFAETLGGIRALADAGVSVQTNTTITRKNAALVPDMPEFLASLCRRSGGRIITRFAMNMYIPGTGPGLREDLFVGYDEIGTVVDEVRRKAFLSGMSFYWYSPTPFCHYNPIARGMGNKSCAAADGLVSVAPDGNILPCSSWNEPLGNILSKRFGDIWFSGQALLLKHKNAAPVSCRACSSFTACQGACPLYWRACGTGLLEHAACHEYGSGA